MLESKRFADLHSNATILKGLLADSVTLLARFPFCTFDGIELQKAIEVLLLAPEGINIKPTN
jgi:hypothetical protein